MKAILDTLKATFSPELVGHLAARLGEGEHRVRKALGAVVPVVLSGLIQKANAGASQQVYGLSLLTLRQAPVGTSTVTGVLGMLGSGMAAGGALWQAETLLVALFGSGTAAAMAAPVSSYAAIKPSSADALLKLVGAVVLATLGKHVATHGSTSQELATGLIGLKEPVQTLLPKDLPALLVLVSLDKAEPKASTRVFESVRRGAAPVLDLPARLGHGLLAVAGVVGCLTYAVRAGEDKATAAGWAAGMAPASDLGISLATLEFVKLWNLAW